MKRTDDQLATSSPPHERRWLRNFAVLHLRAVGVIDAVPLTAGGGDASLPMPTAAAASVALFQTAQLKPAAELPLVASLATTPSAAWAQLAEAAAPWEQR